MAGTLTWLGHSAFRIDTPGGKRVDLYEKFAPRVIAPMELRRWLVDADPGGTVEL